MKIGDRVKIKSAMNEDEEYLVGETAVVIEEHDGVGEPCCIVKFDNPSLDPEETQAFWNIEEELELVTGWTDYPATKVELTREQRLERAVILAKFAFMNYQLQHEAKHGPEGEKTLTNKALVDMMNEALL